MRKVAVRFSRGERGGDNFRTVVFASLATLRRFKCAGMRNANPH